MVAKKKKKAPAKKKGKPMKGGLLGNAIAAKRKRKKMLESL